MVLLFEIFIILVETFSVLIFYEFPKVVTSILFVLSLILFKYCYNKEDKIYYIVAAIIGPLAEIGAIYRGAWIYMKPGLFIIPVWLPLAWGVVIVAIKRIANIIVTCQKNNQ
jgi:hypothetical protein